MSGQLKSTASIESIGQILETKMLAGIPDALRQQGDHRSYTMTELDWIFPVLDDLRIFAQTNDMPHLESALRNAKRAAVRDVAGAPSEPNAMAISGNVIKLLRVV